MTFNTFDKLIAVLSTMSANISTYQTQVGATAADITFISAALANLNYLRSYCDDVDAAKRGVFQIKDTAYRGAITETVPPFPAFTAGASPTTLQAGYLELVNNLIRRFKLGPGYNHDIGVALGFETSDPTPPVDPATLKPTLEAFPAQTDYVASFVVSNRGDSNMWELQASPAASMNWSVVGMATGKSADFTFTPTTPGQPQQFQVRVQLKRNNRDYGLLSDVIYMTVSP